MIESDPVSHLKCLLVKLELNMSSCPSWLTYTIPRWQCRLSVTLLSLVDRPFFFGLVLVLAWRWLVPRLSTTVALSFELCERQVRFFIIVLIVVFLLLTLLGVVRRILLSTWFSWCCVKSMFAENFVWFSYTSLYIDRFRATAEGSDCWIILLTE